MIAKTPRILAVCVSIGCFVALVVATRSAMADGYYGSPLADIYYDPMDGTLTVDSDIGSPLVTLLVAGPQALSYNLPYIRDGFEIVGGSHAYFNGKEQWVGLGSRSLTDGTFRTGLMGRHIVATYAAGLTPQDFGSVEYGTIRESGTYFTQVSFDSLPYTTPPVVGESVFPQVEKLDAIDLGHGDRLGWAVDVSQPYTIVGAPFDDTLAINSGAAHLFRTDVPGGWVEVTKLVASDSTDQHRLGSAVAMHGETAIVSSEVGQVYVFEPDGNGAWVETGRLVPSIPPTRGYGSAVAFDGITAVVTSESSGANAATSHFFQRATNGNWQEVAKFTALDPLSATDLYGRSVAVDGNLAVVSAPGTQLSDGRFYVYEQDELGVWNATTPIDFSGRLGSYFAFDDETIVTALRGSEFSLQVYRPNVNREWALVDTLDTNGLEINFTTALAVDGNTIVVGTPFDDTRAGNAGAAAVYREIAPNDWELVGRLFANDANAGDLFGNAVAIDGTTIVVGAYEDIVNFDTTGGAYLFQETVPGDANLDGMVNEADLAIWADNPFRARQEFKLGDFNQDHVVDVSDFNLWLQHRSRSDQHSQTVPEPLFSPLMALFASLLLDRNKKGV